jgi:hypothetical protein
LQDAYITDSVEKGIIGIDHRTDIFIGWQVLVPRGVTTRVCSVSYQGSFSDFERCFSLPHRAGGLASSIQKDPQVKRGYRNAVPETTNPEWECKEIELS